MFFLNFSAAEFLALLGALGGLIAALYLLDRAKRRKVVSTLRFWTPGGASEAHQSRRKMSDPWSLILQLLSLLLLLLALAQVQWGSRQGRGRDHVALLDTSAWSGARSAEGRGSVLESEKTALRRYLANIPSGDRVMLVAADSLATPLTPFTSDRTQLAVALASAAPGWSALNADQVLNFAQQAQKWSGAVPGDIVYVGPGLASNASVQNPPVNFRVFPVRPDRNNCGIRQLSLKQADNEPDTWTASLRLRNDSSLARTVRLDLRCAGVRFQPRTLLLAPGEERSADYRFAMRGTGDLVASLAPDDSLAADNQARVRVPQATALRIALYTNRADRLRPLLEANRQVRAVFLAPGEYKSQPAADLVVLDQFAPAQLPAIPALWIDPPAERSPLPVHSTAHDIRIVDWSSPSAHADLRGRELLLPAAQIFQTFPGDQVVARSGEGAVVVLRPGKHNVPAAAVIGFDPANARVRFDVSVPLLFANLLEWLGPESFLSYEVSAERAGLTEIPLEGGVSAETLRVEDEAGARIPYTLRQNSLELFSAQPANLKVISPERERLISISLPDVADREWKLPSSVPQTLPGRRLSVPAAVDLWKWLAALGALGLLAEWLIFGPQRSLRRRRASVAAAARSGADLSRNARELVAK